MTRDALGKTGPGEVLSIIRGAYPSLSSSERKVADYLLQQPGSISVLSISDLALSVGVSETTVLRFAKRLHYTGFAEFKRALLGNLFTNSSGGGVPAYQELTLSDDPVTVMAKVFALLARTLHDTAAVLNPEQFDRASRAIAGARRLEIYSHGGSGYIALNVTFKFLRIGLRCTACVDEFIQENAAQLLDPQDVVIALSHTGATPSVLQAARNARERGITTIAITNNALSPLARQCEITLLTAVAESPIGSEAGATRVAQVAVLDALAVAVALLRKH